MRIVDWLPVVLRHRRAGDVVEQARRGGWATSPAGTIVVREGRASRCHRDAGAPGGEESAAVTLSSADATLVRDFLVRRGGLDPSARIDLAQRLAAALAHRYQLPFDAESDPERFLEHLAG